MKVNSQTQHSTYPDFQWFHDHHQHQQQIDNQEQESKWLDASPYILPDPPPIVDLEPMDTNWPSIANDLAFQKQPTQTPLSPPDSLSQHQPLIQSKNQSSVQYLFQDIPKNDPGLTIVQAESIIANLQHSKHWNDTIPKTEPSTFDMEFKLEPKNAKILIVNHQPGPQWNDTIPKKEPSTVNTELKINPTTIPPTTTQAVLPTPRKLPVTHRKSARRTRAQTNATTSPAKQPFQQLVSRSTQTNLQLPKMVSTHTQTTNQLHPNTAPEIVNVPHFQPLYKLLKRMDKKIMLPLPHEVDQALRLVQTKQMLLQSFNIQVAQLNKKEATTIFGLYTNFPFKPIPRPPVTGTLPASISVTTLQTNK